MVDISDQMSLVSSTPQEAAENVNESRVFDMSPSSYKDIKSELKPHIESLKRPSTATEIVSRYVASSAEHAALAAPDVDKLSTMETQIKTAGRKPSDPNPEEELVNLKMKKDYQPDSFTTDDDIRMFQLTEELKGTQQYAAFEPKEHEELINKATEANKEGGFFSDASKFLKAATVSSLGGAGNVAADIGSYMYDQGGFVTDVTNAAASGAATLNANLAKTPALLYDLYFYPANLIRQAKGEPQLEAPDTLKNNEAIKYYSESATYFAEKVPDLNKSITESVRNGDLLGASKIASVQLANNLPNQAAMILAGLSGYGAAGLVMAGTTTAAASNFENQQQGISPTASIPNALAKGTIEAGFESLGTLGILKTWETALTASFGKDSARTILKNTVKSIMYSGLGEANEEGLTSAAQDITDYVSGVNPDALKGIGKRALDAAIIGGLSGATMTAPAAIATSVANNVESRSSDITNPSKGGPVQQAVQILRFTELFKNISKDSKALEMHGHAPGEVTEIRKQMFEKSGVAKVWVTKENATKWASNPEKAKMFMDAIDPSGKTAAAYDASIPIETHKFMDIVDAHPDIIDIMQLTPEGPTKDAGRLHLEKIWDANNKRKAVLEKYKVQEAPTDLTPVELTPEDIQALDEARMPTESDVFGEKAFLEQPTFTDALKEVLPETEINNWNKAELEARAAIASSINESAQYEMDEMRDVVTEDAIQAQFEIERDRVANDPNIAIVDKFTGFERTPGQTLYPTTRYPEPLPSELTASHHKKGFSPVAIDPRSLPEHLQKFLDNPRLKANKVFVKGGVSVSESAKMLGINSADNLLKLLAATPSRKEVVRQQVELRKKDIEDRVNETVELDKTTLIKAYTADVKLALQKMKIIKDAKWPTFRKMLRRTISLPTIESIQNEVATMVSNARIGSLNVNMFKAGARRSQRNAFDSLAKLDSEKGLIHLENYARNQELAKQTHLAIGEMNRAFKFAKKFNDKEILRELKDAGEIYLKAAMEILDVYHLSPTKKGTSESGTFEQYLNVALASNEPVTVIPKRLQDVRQSANEMSVEQVRAAVNALKGILHNARMKNKLYAKHEKIQALQTIEAIGEKLSETAKTVFDYDERKLNGPQQDPNGIAQLGQHLKDAKNIQERMQFHLMKLQNEQIIGDWTEALWRPRVDAETAADTLMREVDAHHKELIARTIGEKEFSKMGAQWITPPEFAKAKSLYERKGRMSKAELLKALLNMGNEGNSEYVQKTFGVTEAQFMQVAQRELDFTHMEYVQGVWNIFKSFEPELAALQKRTKSEDFIPIKPKLVFFTKNGVTRQYPGGYFQIQTVNDIIEIQGKRLIGSTTKTQLDNFRQRYHAEAMTEQGHFEKRVGSNNPLDLNINGIGHAMAQVIHDLKNREAIRDTVKLLLEPKIRDAMISVIGIDGYSTIADSTIRWADPQDGSYNKAGELTQKLMDHVGGGLHTVMLIGKLGTLLIQTGSLPFAVNRMGLKGINHFTKMLHRVTSNPQDMKQYYEFAARIHPSIRASMEDFEGNLASSFNKALPQPKLGGKVGATVSAVNVGMEKIADVGGMVLGKADEFLKVLVVNAAYSQAINGDVDGIAKDDVEQATKYAADLAEATLTHNKERNKSPIQLVKWLKPALYFFSDLNNIFNFMVSGNRKVKAAVKEGSYTKSLAISSGLVLTIAVAKLIEDTIHGQDTPFDDDDKEKDAKVRAKEMAEYVLYSPINVGLATQPVIRDITNALSLEWMKNKQVVFPLNKVINDGTNAIAGLDMYLKSYGDVPPTKAQQKAIINTVGYVLHLPAGAFYNYIMKPDWKNMSVRGVAEKGLIKEFDETVHKFIKDYADKKINPPAEFVESVKKLNQDINPQSAKRDIPPETYDIIKQIESGGKWNAYDPNTGAAGIYQFTEAQWKEIQAQAPELGLTENGRVSRNTEQQEEAMKWKTERDSEALATVGLEINSDNLVAAHKLGTADAVKLLQASNDTKIKTLVGSDILTKNKLPASTKVKDFKLWLFKKTVEAQTEIDKTATNVKD